jgi:hypothetical protein
MWARSGRRTAGTAPAAGCPRPDHDHAILVLHILDDQARQPGEHNPRWLIYVTHSQPCHVQRTVAGTRGWHRPGSLGPTPYGITGPDGLVLLCVQEDEPNH